MKEKIASAIACIEMIAREYKNPIIYSGMGKDSLPLIHLCHKIDRKWDVMFHRDPHFPKKYKYANRIIENWNLVVRDYPPRICSIFFHNDTYEVVREYEIGYQNLALCAMLYTPDEYIPGEYLCALRDIYLMPKGGSGYGFKWDIGLMSHRFTEKKPHGKMIPNNLKWQLKRNIGSCDFVYPMWDWTDKDMYQYHVDNGIPINTDVYDVIDGELIPKKDSTYNPDRRPACYECMRPDRPETVICPRTACTVNNVWNDLVKVIMPTDFPATEEKVMYPKEA